MSALPAPLPPADAAPVRFGSAMLRRFGWFFHAVGLGRVMENVRFEEHSVERIREAQRRGTVVYVLKRRSALDHLALNAVLNRRRLPLSRWANGVTMFWWQPVAEAWLDVWTRLRARVGAGVAPDPVSSGWLTRMVASGLTATVFVGEDDPRTGEDPLHALLEAQAQSDRPILIVPIIVVWTPAPDVDRTAAASFLIGSREDPTLLSALGSLYLPAGPGPFVQAGEAVDLSELSPTTRVSSLRTLLRRYLKRESKVVRGPTLLPYATMKQLVLDNPPMRQIAAQHAASTGRTVAEVQRELNREYEAVAANFSWGVIRFLSWAMRPIWTRVFSGYDIRTEDLDRIRAAARTGAPVLAPCHKSHFDYMLLSWICFHADIIVPHVVAGINLAIWPVSLALRACGGFFIKRSFTGEQLHAAVFGRYLRELLLHGYTVEFFIEGGRTRTGMLLRPKLGVLGMVADAAVKAPPDHEVTLLPISISYEQVAEEREYRRELGGAAKEKESVGQLIQARSVLARKFGRLYVRVGEPIPMRAALGDAEAWATLPEDARREVLQRVGERLVHRIGVVTVVLPTSMVALALLAHHRQGISHADLMARVGRLLTFLKRAGALLSDSLAHVDAAIAQALDRFARDGMVRSHHVEDHRVWEIIPEQRVLLDFHKNQVLQHFVPAALAAAAARGHGAARFTADDLLPGWRLLRSVLRRELVLNPDLDDAAQLTAALADLEAHGALELVDGAWQVADVARISELHGLLRGLLESYLVVARAASRAPASVEEALFVKELQAGSEAWLAAGTVTRPEALGAVALRNAFAALRELGLASGEGKHLTPDRVALEAFLPSLAPMIEG
jgi:glycerol-3-phosphate O-acyltransferase